MAQRMQVTSLDVHSEHPSKMTHPATIANLILDAAGGREHVASFFGGGRSDFLTTRRLESG